MSTFLQAIEMGVGAWAWGDRMVWQYGAGYTDEDVRRAFFAAVENGIALVDTAEIYGRGRSERLIGEFLPQLQRPVLVATKYFPYPWRLGGRPLRRALRASLQRLGLEQVDLYQIHWPTPLVSIDALMRAMADAVEEGLVRAVGVSNYNEEQMMLAQSALQRRGLRLAANQVEYSLLNRQVEKNGLLKRCQEMDVRLIAYSPLAMGLLTGKYTPQNPPPGLRGRKYGRRLAAIQPLIDLLRQIGQAHGGKTPAQVALNWTICKGALPIPGAKNARQAEMNAGALGWRLTEDEVAALDEASDRV